MHPVITMQACIILSILKWQLKNFLNTVVKRNITCKMKLLCYNNFHTFPCPVWKIQSSKLCSQIHSMLGIISRFQYLYKKLIKIFLQVMKKYNDVDLAININGTLQKVIYLQNDIQNVVEFVRRIREEGIWNTEGLKFYQVTYSDLFGSNFP